MDHHGAASGAKSSCKDAKLQLVQIGPAPVYWKTPEERLKGARPTGEFPGGLPGPAGAAGSSRGENRVETTRRDFLSLMGFSLAAAGLSGCRAPVQNAVPLLAGSDQIIPGVSNYYATTCGGCASSCSLLVKQRDGRPIKIEGNAQSALFGGGTCATGQATVLSLYDDARLRKPLWRKPSGAGAASGSTAAGSTASGSAENDQWEEVSWAEIDRRVSTAMHGVDTDRRKVVLLSGTITSPSTLEIIAAWGRRFPNFRHVMYDAVSFSALRAAQRESFGRAVVPHYRFDKTRVIVGIDADFLGTWLSPVEFTRQYASTRKVDENRSLHIQFESGLSVTGSNADVRVPLAPSDFGVAVLALLRRVAEKAGQAGVPAGPDPIDAQKLDAIADELWKHRGASLVVCGVQDVNVQIAVNALNNLLGNIGATLDMARPSLQRAGDDAALVELVDDMDHGNVHTLMLYGVNPGYDYPEARHFLDAMEKVPLSISFSDRLDETSSKAQVLCPNHHFLEAWGDAEPVDSSFSLAQPLIAPLFSTRAAQESLLQWLGDDTDHYTYLRNHWRKNIFPRQAQGKDSQDFDAFWDRTLQDGVLELPAKPAAASFHGDWKAAAQKIYDSYQKIVRDKDRFEVQVYESVPMRDGRHANNPWLQELPDPISKNTWGNYAAIAPKLAKDHGLENGDVISLKTDSGKAVELPVLIQPGQQAGAISIALGHGREKAGKAGNNVGVNVFALAAITDKVRRYSLLNVSLTKTGQRRELATTQGDFSMPDERGKDIVQETSLEELQHPAEAEPEELSNLWEKRLIGEHQWGMAVDINACTGCSACVVACQAENNVPVVGKDQVQRIRIMHWIRVDHYYSGDDDNPVSVHQPMMCQHCGNAPCETVCPVLATTTSSEGLNQQVYNRCIGTRYCANNCPYKVRRFNWYNYTEKPMFFFNIAPGEDYNMASDLGRMVLNPDVVVRSRGVMEKCSLCVQRIQLAKNIALQGRRDLADGDIQTACQQACPADAIVFGDLLDPNSRVSQLRRGRRHYNVLEDLGTRPNVGYLKKVSNAKI